MYDEPVIKKGYNNKSQECDADWSKMRNFKTTVIEKKQGIEKKINEINRTFQFNKSIDSEGINAELNHGLLSIKIPKKESKTITISI